MPRDSCEINSGDWTLENVLFVILYVVWDWERLRIVTCSSKSPPHHLSLHFYLVVRFFVTDCARQTWRVIQINKEQSKKESREVSKLVGRSERQRQTRQTDNNADRRRR